MGQEDLRGQDETANDVRPKHTPAAAHPRKWFGQNVGSQSRKRPRNEPNQGHAISTNSDPKPAVDPARPLQRSDRAMTDILVSWDCSLPPMR